jgi:predicted TPR repeat methyltransferase
VGSKRERRADRALVSAYHQARLGELVEHVADAVDRFRAGELDAYAVDEVLHQYQRAARELWKFCWLAGAGAGVELTARVLRDMADEGESIDWWTRGARHARRAPPAAEQAGSPLAPETRPENPTSP